MPIPMPNQGDATNRAAGVLEGALPGIDARSQNAPAAVIARMIEAGSWDLYFALAYLGVEMMPDTAVDTLAEHAAIWGITQVQATPAIGNALVTGNVTGSVIPIGTQATAPGGAVFQTTATATTQGGVGVSVPVASVVAGSAQSQAAGTVLTLVSPLPGLASQTLTLDSNGAVGEDAESTEAMRARLLARIRQPPSGGAWADYVQWVKQALPGVGYVGVLPAGTSGTPPVAQGAVSIFFAMSGLNGGPPTAPTPAQVTAVQDYIGVFGGYAGVRPVTANVTVYAATLTPVNVSLQVRPNTVAIQTAAQQALALAFAQDATIGGSMQANGGVGGTIYVSRLDDAVSSSDGEYDHERLAPSADVTVGVGQLPVLGTVTFS